MKENKKHQFKHTLALALGMTIGEIDQMPVTEFRDWIIYNSISPIGGQRLDFNCALIAMMIGNLFSKQPKSLDHYMLKFEKKTNKPFDFDAAFKTMAGMYK